MKHICITCIGDKFLRKLVASHHQQGTCNYCNKESTVVSIEPLSELIKHAIIQHYTARSMFGLFDKVSKGKRTAKKKETIIEAIEKNVKIPEAAVKDIQVILANKYGRMTMFERMFKMKVDFNVNTPIHMYQPTDEVWQQKWQDFEQSLKTESRYFSSNGLKLLQSIFADLEALQTNELYPLIRYIGPGTSIESLYRARVFQSNEKLSTALNWPDMHLGSPPSNAAVGGRMNAKGISVFYGTNDRHTAMAEVRPPVGSRVVTARFEIIRELNVLDLSALRLIETSGSIFDSNFIEHKQRASFLYSFSQRMTRPVMPDDETIEYIITQAIADFLSSESDLDLDGIIFPSVQAGDGYVNVVLFHKASLVERLNLEKIKDIKVELGSPGPDGIPSSYGIQEIACDSAKDSPAVEIQGRPQPEKELNKRKPTLRLDTDSLLVHVVKAVNYTADEFPIKRVTIKETPPLMSTAE
jgi:hypothetical protein